MNEEIIDVAPEPPVKKTWIGFLLSPKAGKVLPNLFFAAFILGMLLQKGTTFLVPIGYQVSGYYLAGLLFCLLFPLAAAWLISIFLLFFKRQITQGVGRLLAIPLILFGMTVILLPARIFLSFNISNWPLDYVYSSSDDKYYFLVLDSVPTDTCYNIFSTSGTLLNPIWKLDFGGWQKEYSKDGKTEFRCSYLDYSEDGSLTGNSHLILSKDEQLLVVGRGGQLTDAILIDIRQPLTNSVDWSDGNREVQWRQRTEEIERLLAEHAQPRPLPAEPMSDAEVKATLESWCRSMEEEMAQNFCYPKGSVSFQIEEINRFKSGRIQVNLIIECKKDGLDCRRPYRIAVVQEGGQLLIIQGDNRLPYSSSEDSGIGLMIFELNQLARNCTYLNPSNN